jgi:hypothetical protein
VPFSANNHAAPTRPPGELQRQPDATYQVVNVDDFSDCVWLRRFPLRERRLPTFSVPADQVRPIASELS